MDALVMIVDVSSLPVCLSLRLSVSTSVRPSVRPVFLFSYNILYSIHIVVL